MGEKEGARVAATGGEGVAIGEEGVQRLAADRPVGEPSGIAVSDPGVPGDKAGPKK